MGKETVFCNPYLSVRGRRSVSGSKFNRDEAKMLSLGTGAEHGAYVLCSGPFMERTLGRVWRAAHRETADPPGLIAHAEATQMYKKQSHENSLPQRIHCGVEVTELSTNKQHTHKKGRVQCAAGRASPVASVCRCCKLVYLCARSSSAVLDGRR
jgi:hypothetical protein